ncbi:MAG: TIGR01777 family oxidoreductase [Maribacter sp.]
MKVLITGATGLVGSELVKQCHDQGYSVNYLTTSKEKIENRSDYQGFYWNPKKGAVDSSCLQGVFVIINLAGASISERWTSAYKKVVLNSRLDSLNVIKKLLEESESNTVTSIISASAIGIYPDSIGDYYSEDFQKVDDSFLGEVVEAWENKVDELKGLVDKVAKVRIGLVLSNDGGALPQMAKPVKFYVGAAFGSGEQWQSWIHISDLAGIFLHIAKNELEGVFNGVAPNPVTNNRLIKEIAHTLQKPLFLPNIPKIAMHTLLGDMAYILFASQRVSSKKIEEHGYVFDYSNICQALADIYEEDPRCDTPSATMSKQYSSHS